MIFRYIGIFFILFFLSYSATYALPVWSVVPFVFDIVILLYTSIIIIGSWILFYVIKFLDFFVWALFSIVIISFIILYLWIGIDISLSIGSKVVPYRYVMICVVIIFIFGIIQFYLYKRYLLIIWASCFLLFINIPLLYSTYELDSKFNTLMWLLHIKSDGKIIMQSDKNVSNIAVYQNFKYEDMECRITLSYYRNKHKFGYSFWETHKSSVIILYTWWDFQKCDTFIRPLYSRYILNK